MGITSTGTEKKLLTTHVKVTGEEILIELEQYTWNFGLASVGSSCYSTVRRVERCCEQRSGTRSVCNVGNHLNELGMELKVRDFSAE